MLPSAGANSPPGPLFAGKYKIESQLPWGGLAAYYRATVDENQVILAVLPINLDKQPALRPEFTRVARARALVRTRVAPELIHASVEQGVPYLVLRDTRGALLQDLINDHPLNSTSVLRVASDVLEALDVARGQGLMHVDITPQNILVVRESDRRIGARLLGLGIAPLVRGPASSGEHNTTTGSGQHSVTYMAPEMFGGRDFDHPADIYSVGALLHHMVQGSPPVGWEADEGFDDVPGLREIIERAMARRPRDRYSTAKAMQTALEWVEIESVKRNPRTQDIAPWMEHSRIGSIPVAAIASSLPPSAGHSSHPPGTVLSSKSGARAMPIGPPALGTVEAGLRHSNPPAAPVVLDQREAERSKRWGQIAILLLCILLLTLVSLLLDS